MALISKEIRKAQITLGLSPDEFAALCGVNRSTYFRWANGDRTPPGPALRLIELMLWLKAKGQGNVLMEKYVQGLKHKTAQS